MLRTSMTVAAMLLVGVAVLFATRSAISNEGTAAATPAACPCGQCDAGCQCCLDDDVSCEDCACDKCECEGCDTTATKSCCDGKGNCEMTANADGAQAMTAAVAAACACGECDADCQCCSDDSVSCEDCSCESCQCTKCDDQVATSA